MICICLLILKDQLLLIRIIHIQIFIKYIDLEIYTLLDIIY